MRSTVLGFDRTSHTGAISGHDGNRYDFTLSEWKSVGIPAPGVVVDFVPVGGRAEKIYTVNAANPKEGWLTFLFSWQGRIPRKRYWLSYVLPAFGIYFLAAFVDAILANGAANRSSVAQGLVTLFFLWPGFAVAAKRLHDRGMSGWWAAVANGFLPIVILAVAAYWYYTNKMRVAADGSAAAAGDTGTAAVFALIGILFAIVWLYFAIQVAFVRGQIGENKYGDDPLPTEADIRSDNTVTALFGTFTVLVFLVLPVSAYWYYTNKMAKAPEEGASTEDMQLPTENEAVAPAPSPEEQPATSLDYGPASGGDTSEASPPDEQPPTAEP